MIRQFSMKIEEVQIAVFFLFRQEHTVGRNEFSFRFIRSVGTVGAFLINASFWSNSTG